MPGEPDPRDVYVSARRVLLDALEALQAHLPALTLVGAQAIYLRVGEADDVGVPPYPSDADLAIDPTILGFEPEIGQTLQTSGFVRQQDPGIWKSASLGFTVDLLVPANLGGPGRRAARLTGHGKNVAHKVRGLDAALVDRARHLVAALDPADPRQYEVSVAGPTALLIAKLYKIWERRGVLSREDAKDALDLLRLLRAASTEELVNGFRRVLEGSDAREEAEQALQYLDELFHDETADGPRLVRQAVGGLANREEAALASVVLAQDLLTAARPPTT